MARHKRNAKMRTIAEIEPMIYAATRNGGKATAKSEQYRQLVIFAKDHPEMYNEKQFRATLSTQTFRLGILKKRLEEIHSQCRIDEYTGKYKYPDFLKVPAAQLKAEIRNAERYVATCLYVLGERRSI